MVGLLDEVKAKARLYMESLKVGVDIGSNIVYEAGGKLCAKVLNLLRGCVLDRVAGWLGARPGLSALLYVDKIQEALSNLPRLEAPVEALTTLSNWFGCVVCGPGCWRHSGLLVWRRHRCLWMLRIRQFASRSEFADLLGRAGQVDIALSAVW